MLDRQAAGICMNYIIEIGRRLVEAKSMVADGMWLEYIKILQDDNCPLFMVFGELEQLVDYLIANSVTVETQTKQSLVYGDYIRCSEDQVPEVKELLLKQMIATIRELAKKDDFFEVSDLEDAETAERIKVSWKFSIPHMKD